MALQNLVVRILNPAMADSDDSSCHKTSAVNKVLVASPEVVTKPVATFPKLHHWCVGVRPDELVSAPAGALTLANI
jgi:hypothetical protein